MRGKKRKQKKEKKANQTDQFFSIKPKEYINGIEVLTKAEVAVRYGKDFLVTMDQWS